jgi:hypothetical protein
LFGTSVKNRIILILAAFTVVLAAAIILGRAISGGEKTFLSVEGVLKTHSYILDRVGSPVKAVDQNDGPWRVSLASDGHRHGYYSVTAEGPKGKEALKAYWRELPNGMMEVYAIYQTKAATADKLLWGAPRPELD